MMLLLLLVVLQVLQQVHFLPLDGLFLVLDNYKLDARVVPSGTLTPPLATGVVQRTIAAKLAA
jgi:hypothetical protein